MKYVLLGYRPATQVGVYADDHGHIAAICDEVKAEMPADWFALEDSPKVYRLPFHARDISFYTAGRRLGDYPSEPAWYFDPARVQVQALPLERYLVDDWLFYARWLGAWGERIWAVADPIDLRKWPDAATL